MTKLFLEALHGEKTEKIPFWFMRQAGRYLPEYRELRAKKGGFLEMAMDPKCACEITLQPLRRFGMDAAIIFSDILVVPMALGMDLKFEAGEGPRLNALEKASDVSRLNFSRFGDLNFVYEALALTREGLEREGFQSSALIGFAGAPWTVATYMIEGGSSRDFLKTKLFAYKDPEGFSVLMELLAEATGQYLVNQIKAGAEAIQIFDSWAGAVDAQNFRRWCIEPVRKIVEIVRALYPEVPIIGFPKGAGYNVLAYAQQAGVSALGLDHSVPSEWAARVLQPLMPVQGNLDPFCLLAGGGGLVMAAEKIISDFRSGPFVFNLGHGIHKDTPLEHVEKLVETIRAYG